VWNVTLTSFLPHAQIIKKNSEMLFVRGDGVILVSKHVLLDEKFSHLIFTQVSPPSRT
jgi:hypothetical protein